MSIICEDVIKYITSFIEDHETFLNLCLTCSWFNSFLVRDDYENNVIYVVWSETRWIPPCIRSIEVGNCLAVSKLRNKFEVKLSNSIKIRGLFDSTNSVKNIHCRHIRWSQIDNIYIKNITSNEIWANKIWNRLHLSEIYIKFHKVIIPFKFDLLFKFDVSDKLNPVVVQIYETKINESNKLTYVTIKQEIISKSIGLCTQIFDGTDIDEVETKKDLIKKYTRNKCIYIYN